MSIMNRNNYFNIQALLQSSNAGKQKIGQRIAFHLGFVPGPRGKDDGIDGFIIKDGVRIHFQSKLRNVHLDIDDARGYYSDIIFHKANISIILSGVGFKNTFRDRLYGHEGIESITIHMLNLNDIFENNDAFRKACEDLPSLRHLDQALKDNVD